MSKNQKKAPKIYYFLKDKLANLQQQKLELESQLTVKPQLELVKALSLVNYHIECTENRIAEKFNDPIATEYALMTSNKTYTGVR